MVVCFSVLAHGVMDAADGLEGVEGGGTLITI